MPGTALIQPQDTRAAAPEDWSSERNEFKGTPCTSSGWPNCYPPDNPLWTHPASVDATCSRNGGSASLRQATPAEGYTRRKLRPLEYGVVG
eukprot:4032726-Amphidinium_carterae.1